MKTTLEELEKRVTKVEIRAIKLEDYILLLSIACIILCVIILFV